jgi:DNA-binding PadR family transcriptional regulator
MTPPTDPSAPPLRPAVYHILLALAERDLHGLGVADAIDVASEGVLELGPGTLYRSLSELTDAGLIEPVAAPEPDADPRRKYYAITSVGQRVLERETARLERLVETARRRMLPEGA